jgi:hypothetical protein
MLFVSIALVDLLDELPSVIIYTYPINDADLNQGQESGTGTAYPSRAHEFTCGF